MLTDAVQEVQADWKVHIKNAIIIQGRALSFHVQVDETSVFTVEFPPEKQVVQSPRKVRVMTDLKTAWQCCLENSGDLLVSLQLSRILCMEDEEAAEALERFFSAEFIEDNLVEPLIFVFTFMQDILVLPLSTLQELYTSRAGMGNLDPGRPLSCSVYLQPNQTHLNRLIEVFRITRNFTTDVCLSLLVPNSSGQWPSKIKVPHP
ncbi:uncharacterized protein LOC130550056 [Triplophysa rosa]|uniref:uncharacterized protein LOC130550056 n=1 Tax=Triplophysa rosa TaxID=992332 RepID=UPI0025460A3B|nr:uncharacterized protein LOC130550056 [Triplophysa rosa]